MGIHNISDASLAELVDRALGGEVVVVTRDGKPVAEIHAIPQRDAPRPMTAADLDWLAERRKGIGGRSEVDAGTLVSQMRDEDWR